MNTSPSHPAVSAVVALQTLQERREDAVRRARVREIRGARRQERRTARREAHQTGATPPTTRPLPWWVFRFLHAAH